MALQVRIVQDEMAESPREWDNLGTLVSWHRRCNLGDVNLHDGEPYHLPKNAVVLPVFIYEHSGMTISTDNSRYPFTCPWDSGQVGVIYADRETIRKEYSRQRVSKKLEAKVRSVLEGEISTLDQHLRGDVWGYEVVDTETDEVVDSCWGFIGREFVEQEAELAREQAELENMRRDDGSKH